MCIRDRGDASQGQAGLFHKLRHFPLAEAGEIGAVGEGGRAEGLEIATDHFLPGGPPIHKLHVKAGDKLFPRARGVGDHAAAAHIPQQSAPAVEDLLQDVYKRQGCGECR